MDLPMPAEAEIPQNGTDPSPAPEADSNHLWVYSDSLRVLSKRLLRTDWPKQFKTEPYVIASVTYILRDIIRSLEYLHEQPGERGRDMEEALQELNIALRALYVAETVATPTDTARIEVFYDNVSTARNSLSKASQMLAPAAG